MLIYCFLRGLNKNQKELKYAFYYDVPSRLDFYRNVLSVFELTFHYKSDRLTFRPRRFLLSNLKLSKIYQ